MKALDKSPCTPCLRYYYIQYPIWVVVSFPHARLFALRHAGEREQTEDRKTGKDAKGANVRTQLRMITDYMVTISSMIDSHLHKVGKFPRYITSIDKGI
jgi:hypothetical protein